MNRSGQAYEMAFAIVGLAVIVVSAVLGAYLHTQFNSVTNTVLDNDNARSFMEGTGKIYTFFDNIFPFIYLSLLGAVVISALFVKSHPAFFIFNVILLIFVSFTSVAINNFVADFVTSPVMNATAEAMPKTAKFGTTMPLFVIVGGFLYFIVFFAKGRSEGL